MSAGLFVDLLLTAETIAATESATTKQILPLASCLLEVPLPAEAGDGVCCATVSISPAAV